MVPGAKKEKTSAREIYGKKEKTAGKNNEQENGKSIRAGANNVTRGNENDSAKGSRRSRVHQANHAGITP